MNPVVALLAASCGGRDPVVLVTDLAHDSDSPGDSEPWVDPGYTGFTATSTFSASISGESWCEATIAITGARSDDRCSGCTFAFAVEAVQTSGPAHCATPALGSFGSDAEHLDPFLAYEELYVFDYYYEYEYPRAWFLGYTPAYTSMDVYGSISTEVSARPTTLWLDQIPHGGYGAPVEMSDAGFSWSSTVAWFPERLSRLWTSCTSTVDDVTGSPDGILGDSTVQAAAWNTSLVDQWSIPLAAGAQVHIAVDGVGEYFPGASLYLVRPDDCLALVTSVGFACPYRDTSQCPAVDFVPNVGGDWHLVVALGDGTGSTMSTDYQLGVQADGEDISPTLLEDDVELIFDPARRVFTAAVTLEGTWLR
jgi:hypothetical protein